MPTALSVVLILTLAGLTSIPAFTKHTSVPILATIAHTAFMAMALALSVKLVPRWIRSARFDFVSCVVLCCALAVANGALYPRTRLMAPRSSAPDAMIVPAMRATHGIHPYADLLFDGAAISPGPGWIAIHAPLTTTGAIWLIMPLHLMLAAWMLSRHHVSVSLAFVMLMMALPVFLQMSLVGHDLFAVGCAMLTITLGTWQYASRGTSHLIAWSIAAGVVATARAPLAVFVAVLALVIGRRDVRAGVRFFAVAALTAFVIHGFTFLWGISLGLPYQPLHVFRRAANAGVLVLPIGFALCAGLALWQWRRGTERVGDALLFAWAIVGLPFVFIGLGELRGAAKVDWVGWEGKVYVGFALPLLISALLLHLNPRTGVERSHLDLAGQGGAPSPADHGELPRMSPDAPESEVRE